MADLWPKHWTRKKLGEIADVNWGDTSVTKASYVATGYPAYSASGPDGFLPYADYNRTGIVLSAIGAECGRTWLVKGKWSCIKNTIRFWSIHPDVDTEFLYWLTCNPAIWPKRGSAQPFISQSDARNLIVAYPPIQEQRAIAHILGTLDDKIELNRKINETLEQMARAIFKSWFIDFEPVRAKMEGRWEKGQSLPGLPAHLYDLFPDCLVCTEFGEIPEGWEFEKIGNLVQVIKGRSYKSEELRESDTALITLKSFARGGGYRPEGLKPFIGDYKFEQVVAPGEVIIACTDITQSADVIGHAALVRRSPRYQRLVASLDIFVVRPADEKITPAFLYYLSSTESFIEHNFSYVTGTTVLHLAKEAVTSFTFPLPPQRLIQVFTSFSNYIFNRIQQVEIENENLASLRDILLPKLMRGELRIQEAEIFLQERGL